MPDLGAESRRAPAFRFAAGEPHPEPIVGRQFETWNAYRLPATEQVGDGTWAVAVPVDADGRSFVYLYILDTGDGLALIDTGYDTPGALDYLGGELAALGLALAGVRHVLCSHYHRDHFGNARELKRLTGASLYLHPIDQLVLHTLGRVEEHRERQMRLWLQMGWTTPLRPEELGRAGNPYFNTVPAEPDAALQDGQVIELGRRRLEVVWVPGHSPGQVCFFERSSAVLFAGDQLLPRLTPGVSIQPFQRPNPLADFTASLRRLSALEATVAHPGHEYSFRDPHARIRAILAHHDARLAEILAVVRAQPGLDCTQVASQVSWSRPWSTMTGRYGRMAAGETMAHLVLLEDQGMVTPSGYEPARWWPTDSLAEPAP